MLSTTIYNSILKTCFLCEFFFQYLHTDCQHIPVYKHIDKCSALCREHRRHSFDRDFGMAAEREKKIQLKMQWVSKSVSSKKTKARFAALNEHNMTVSEMYDPL